MAKGKYGYWLTDDGLLLLAAWARDGLTDEQIAAKCGITAKTVYEWKKKYGEIGEALKKGKEIADIAMENRLYETGMGAFYTEEQAFKLKRVYYDDRDRRCEEERLEVVELTKQRPPDVTAQIYWLKNRKPKVWRDKPEGDSEDMLAAIRLLVESNKEAARSVIQQ